MTTLVSQLQQEVRKEFFDVCHFNPSLRPFAPYEKEKIELFLDQTVEKIVERVGMEIDEVFNGMEKWTHSHSPYEGKPECITCQREITFKKKGGEQLLKP